jgi:hypothetical protein
VFERHGPAGCAQLLTHVGRGAPFDVAFADVAGITPAAAESEFSQRQRIWTNSLPIITSTTTLWMAVTLLAILAIRPTKGKSRDREHWEKKDEPVDDDL